VQVFSFSTILCDAVKSGVNSYYSLRENSWSKIYAYKFPCIINNLRNDYSHAAPFKMYKVSFRAFKSPHI